MVDIWLKKALRWQEARNRYRVHPYLAQVQLLHYQLERAKDTQLGRRYGFAELLRAFPSFTAQATETKQAECLIKAQELFSSRVPCFTYEEMYAEWWHKLRERHKNVCWPGQISRFALSSGTTTGSSRRIPVSSEMLQSMQKVMIRQLCALLNCELSPSFYTCPVLFLGGSSSLRQVNDCWEGDISGILAQRMPFWSVLHTSFASRIGRMKQWDEKLEAIIQAAPQHKIGAIMGSPIWVQLLLERIINDYGLEHIHQMWPDLSLFVHGGVSIEPYKESFHKLWGKNINYLETYLASEGFVAYQSHVESHTMQLALEGGLFYEFVPYDSHETNPDTWKSGRPLSLAEVEVHQPYRLLISNLSGLWRYSIGDVVVFHDTDALKISIQGRCEYYLSLCGEHLCLGNLEAALGEVSSSFRLPIKEFVVFGQRKGTGFQHIWHIGTMPKDKKASATEIAKHIDAHLQATNDDYRLQRQMNLSAPRVELLCSEYFYTWLKKQGKWGNQHKFPRVLRGEQLQEWLLYLATRASSVPQCS